jgi:hypothetical protein
MSSPSEPDDRDLRARLRALRVDPPEGEFQAALRRRLLEEGPPGPASLRQRVEELLRGPRPLLWPGLGAFAGAAAAVALLVLQPWAGPPGAAPAGTVTLLPATRVAVVRINLAAEVAVEAAHIRVTLPAGLSFWADGRELPQRSFEWTQALRSGDNEMPIAVRGQRPGRYRIAVDARIGGERVEDEILLDVVDG